MNILQGTLDKQAVISRTDYRRLLILELHFKNQWPIEKIAVVTGRSEREIKQIILIEKNNIREAYTLSHTPVELWNVKSQEMLSVIFDLVRSTFGEHDVTRENMKNRSFFTATAFAHISKETAGATLVSIQRFMNFDVHQAVIKRIQKSKDFLDVDKAYRRKFERATIAVQDRRILCR